MKATIGILLRDDVPDFEGRAVADMLNRQGFSEVVGLKVGRLIEVEVDGLVGVELQRRIESMCSVLLANPQTERAILLKTEDR